MRRMVAFIEFSVAIFGLCLLLLGLKFLADFVTHELAELEMLLDVLRRM